MNRMNHRSLVLAGGLIVLILIIWLGAMPVAGQTSSGAMRADKSSVKGYSAPLTPDGQPDLQGFWTNSTYVPLERPKGVTKALYTEAEAREMEKRAADAESEQTTPGTIADVHYDFTQFSLDRNQSTFAHDLRTSL